MAAKSKKTPSAPAVAPRRIVKRVSFEYLQKLAAAVCIVALVVMLAAGILAGVPVVTVAYRACLVMIAVKIICRILVSVLATYEEIDSGKA